MTYLTREDMKEGFSIMGGCDFGGSLPKKEMSRLWRDATMALLRRRNTLCEKNAPSLNLSWGHLFASLFILILFYNRINAWLQL